MGDIVVTDNAHYSAIASAIRTKNGTENTYTPAQMAPAILALPTASGGYVYQDEQGFVVLDDDGDGPQLTTTTVTPTESEQIVSPTSGYDGFSQVTVEAIDSEYVGSDVARNSSSDLTVSGATVTAPAGYYATAASKSVATATHSKPSVNINSSTGVVTASHTQTAGYVSAGTTSDTLSLTTQAAKTVTPTESEQTAVAAGRYTTGAVKVGAISSTYVGSGIEQRDETDLTASGATVTVPAGYYAEEETKSVASGTAGTPTATKGTVSSHSVTVTPSVTNTAGYISGGTIAGTGVTVSASELVSGTKLITASGNTDVTNYATATVTAVVAGTPTATKGTVSGNAITVTPSVHNSTGWITGGTVTGDPVSVSASEVVSGDLSITANDTYDVTNYASVTVNVPSGSVYQDENGYLIFDKDGSGGGLSVQPLSVTTNGTYTAPTGTAYSPVMVNVSGGGAESKDVNFIDYDGTILHSYSASEAQALTALPENPSHTGLVAQGWNWSLADIKSQLTNVGGEVWVGQMYTTASGASEIDIELDDSEYLAPYLMIAVNGSVSVDWGDNSTDDTITGTSLTSIQYTQHIYSSVGNYTIKISVNSGSFSFYNNDSQRAGCLSEVGTNSYRCYSRYYSGKIKKINIGELANIGNNAFSNCTALKDITIPDSVTSIGNSVFRNCYALESITIPDSVISIGNNDFYNCYAFKNIAIPDSVTNIGSNTFSYCHVLENVTIPDGVITIGSGVFNNCYVLEDVTIPNSVTKIDSSAFYGCHAFKNITIPDSVTSIGSSGFYYCYALENVTIPDGVTSIGSYTFSNCCALKNINIPDSVTTIGTQAFQNCYTLEKVTIPDSVTSIGTNAFSYCYVVKEYHLLPTTPPALAGTNAFTSIVAGTIIYVPQGCLEAYQTATNWSTYASYMQEEPS